jgi:predicted transcriptional regulator of viral defense system
VGINVPDPGNAEVARLAAEQHGVVTRDQLLGIGVTAKAINYRLSVGRLLRLHPGVYAVGHRPPSMLARAMAAVLACGPDAALSHLAAGALWELGPRWPPAMDVTVTTNRRPKGIRLHRSSTLSDRDVTKHFGIPITSPARTVLRSGSAPR